ncbi:hypothetical protein FALCPG4_001867 [Fusarium falciforme]
MTVGGIYLSSPVIRKRVALDTVEVRTANAGGLIYRGWALKFFQADLPQHSAGRQFEDYLQKKYSDLKPAAAGTLQPAFVHCAGSFCYVDPVNPACFVVISPYKSNVELINRLRKKPEAAALAGMADADSFQVQEGDIAVVVMGATGRSGPGFTADEQWLNVILSRQKSGLLVVGDIDAPGPWARTRRRRARARRW